MAQKPHHTLRRGLVALTLVVSVPLAGCAGRNPARLAWFPFRPSSPEAPQKVEQAAPESAVYKVKFATRPNAGPDDFHTYGGARRVVRRGETLGFSHGPDGTVYAIAGDESFPLRPREGRKRVPAYLVWSYQPADHQHSDEFGEALLTAGKVVAIGAIAVGAVALWLWAETHDDDCDCDRQW